LFCSKHYLKLPPQKINNIYHCHIVTQNLPNQNVFAQWSTNKFSAKASINQFLTQLVSMNTCLNMLLFTSNLGIKAAEADCKCLKRRNRVSVIHCKQILPNFSKLQNNLIVFRSSCSIFCGSHQLKVFNRGNCHPSMKV